MARHCAKLAAGLPATTPPETAGTGSAPPRRSRPLIVAAIFYGGMTHNSDVSSRAPATRSKVRAPRNSAVTYPSRSRATAATLTSAHPALPRSSQARARGGSGGKINEVP